MSDSRYDDWGPEPDDREASRPSSSAAVWILSAIAILGQFGLGYWYVRRASERRKKAEYREKFAARKRANPAEARRARARETPPAAPRLKLPRPRPAPPSSTPRIKPTRSSRRPRPSAPKPASEPVVEPRFDVDEQLVAALGQRIIDERRDRARTFNRPWTPPPAAEIRAMALGEARLVGELRRWGRELGAGSKAQAMSFRHLRAMSHREASFPSEEFVKRHLQGMISMAAKWRSDVPHEDLFR